MPPAIFFPNLSTSHFPKYLPEFKPSCLTDSLSYLQPFGCKLSLSIADRRLPVESNITLTQMGFQKRLNVWAFIPKRLSLISGGPESRRSCNIERSLSLCTDGVFVVSLA